MGFAWWARQRARSGTNEMGAPTRPGLLVAVAGLHVVALAQGTPAPLHQQTSVLCEDGAALSAVLWGGGADARGYLRGARVALIDEQGRAVWNGFDASLHPWQLAAGRFAGHQVLMVGVRKTTVLDAIERPRPFIYSIRAGARGLRKVWLGSALSRPYLSACFGNLDGLAEDELVALELTRTGEPALGAYKWEGFGVEGIARSAPIANGRALHCSDVWPGAGEEAVVLSVAGPLWQFTALQPAGERLAPVARVSATVGGQGAEWRLRPRGPSGPGAVRLARGGFTRELPFRPLCP